jgi:hypothetical protein
LVHRLAFLGVWEYENDRLLLFMYVYEYHLLLTFNIDGTCNLVRFRSDRDY